MTVEVMTRLARTPSRTTRSAAAGSFGACHPPRGTARRLCVNVFTNYASRLNSLPSISLIDLTSALEVTRTRSPVIEQVEEIGHLDAADVGEANRQQRRTAAKLEFAGVELGSVGVRRPAPQNRSERPFFS